MQNISYKSSGVNIDEGNRFVESIKKAVESTHNSNVLGGLGGFSGMFDITSFKDLKNPTLVSSTDGVGTKLKIAIDYNKLNTIGTDLVAMSVNDLIVTGATPLFFLDYIATSKLTTENMQKVVEGIVSGCKEANVALLGGETAEMPGMYANNDFDLAGFAVGIVDKDKAINGSRIKVGDQIFGLKSSGFHSNGYSLLRKVLLDNNTNTNNEKIIDLLLEPTKIYTSTVKYLLDNDLDILGMAHITGGGFYENLPRILPENLGSTIYKDRFPRLEIVEILRNKNIIEEKELYRVFNMGVGFVIIIDKLQVENFYKLIANTKDDAMLIGEVNNKGITEISGIDF